MKKIIFVFLFFFIANISFSQIKERSTNVSFYTGIGYKFVFLTNPDARNAYPLFQFSNGDFLKEIGGFLGVTINEKYGIEFSPSYLFTNALSSDGFYFRDDTGLRFYFPQQTRLFALPLNLSFKYYPYGKNYKSTLSKVYLGIGGGAMYVNEEITNQIYEDNTKIFSYGAKTSQNNFWTSNYQVMIGIGNFSKIGYGFELSYRIVPLNQIKNIPIITSIAGNFNSFNLTANIVFSF